MLNADVWSMVLQHVDCTKSLLAARLANKAFKSLIPVEMVTGIPMETARVLWAPKLSRYGKIQLHHNGSDELVVEGALANEGNDFWAWVYDTTADPVRLTQYTVVVDDDDDGSSNDYTHHRTVSRCTTTFTNTNSNVSFLWLKITGNGLVCMLTTSSETPGRRLLIQPYFFLYNNNYCC